VKASDVIIIKSPREIEQMKQACSIVSEILKKVSGLVEPGITTLELDAVAEKLACRYEAIPAFKGYGGYPYSLCCSINEEVVHGMPSERRLCDGDIISIDFGVVYSGFYGDSAVTLPVGMVSVTAARLMQVTKEALYKAIQFAVPGRRLSDISNAVQVYAEKNGFSVVRDFVGHGIGRSLHESPQIPNFGSPGRGVILKPGMVLAIEPMINEKCSNVRMLDDGWTAVTQDGALSAHFEHTVAICENGAEILTEVSMGM
jgi:methionyl aminopeptidase